MKGLKKTMLRTPHNLTSRIGMAKKSSDPEYDDYERKFSAVEQATDKMLKDSVIFRDAVSSLLHSGSTFSNSLSTLFAPLGAEYDLIGRHPQAEATLKNMGSYQGLMEEVRETLSPELELIDSRVVQPCKELQEICKKIRKTAVKRDHKLVDYDRHNNSLNKLREKKEKSLSDEKNLFKVEQDYELASNDYEHYNNLLKSELPTFLAMATRFIDPLFHSFYYMQLNVYFIMLERVQSYADGKYDLSNKDIEGIYLDQRGDTAERLDELGITKRIASTAKLVSTHRSNSISSGGGGSTFSRSASISKGAPLSSPGGLDRKTSYSRTLPPTVAESAPPPYSGGSAGVDRSGTMKKAPPPPPPLKPKPSYGAQVHYCTALYDFTAQADGDLSFKVGDRIELVQRTDSADDWWTGKLNGVQGVFPGSYTQTDS